MMKLNQCRDEAIDEVEHENINNRREKKRWFPDGKSEPKLMPDGGVEPPTL